MASSKYLSAFSVLAALTLSVPAWADIAPDDVCAAASEGNACNNAIGNGTGFLPGICQKSMCSRATPEGPMTYECYRCVADEGGMGGQPNEAGGTAAGGDANGGSAAGSTPVNPPGGSAAGGSAAGGSAAGGSAAGGSKTGSSGAAGASKPSDDSGGCSVSHAPGTGGALGALLLALGLAVSAVRRRRVSAS